MIAGSISDNIVLNVIEKNQIIEAMNQHAIVSVTDERGCILYANALFCSTSGYSKEELIGSTHNIVNSGHHPPEFFADLWRTISREATWSGLIKNRRKDGTYYWVQTTITPSTIGAQGPVFYTAIRTEIRRGPDFDSLVDINTRILSLMGRHAKELLEIEYESHLSTLRRLLGEWLKVLPAQAFVLLKSSTENSRPVVEFSHPQIALKLYDAFETGHYSYLQALRSDANKVSLHQPENEPTACADNDLMKCLAQENIPGIAYLPLQMSGDCEYLLCLLCDSERQFRALDDLAEYLQMIRDHLSTSLRRCARERQSALEKQRLLGRQLLAHVADFDLDLRTLQVRWSPGMFGLSKNLAKIEFNQFLELVHSKDRRLLLAELSNAVNNYRSIEVEFRISNEQAAEIWVQLRGARTRVPNGDADTLVATLIDISRIKHTESELRKSKSLAEHANKAKSNFISHMSHELRTPLNSILGFGQLLQLDQHLEKEQQSNISEIVGAGTHLLKLINDIIDLSVIETGSLNTVLEYHPLKEIIDETVALVSPLAARRNVDLVCQGTFDGHVLVDRLRLKQALINLINNAIKYNQSGGNVIVSCTHSVPYRVLISIADTGVGIAPEDQNSLFTPFERGAKGGSSIEGTGIGLSITKKIIENMGGSIGFTSRPGMGSTFHLEVYAPCATPPTFALDQRDDPNTANSSVALFSDHTATRELIDSTLAMHDGLEVRKFHAHEYPEALQHCATPRVIILDSDTSHKTLESTNDDQNSALRRIPHVGILSSQEFTDLLPSSMGIFSAICLTPINSAELESAITSLLTGVPG
ncbi:hypothetical protein BST95_07570 [Halioglobus japonicus]|uniref:histidine kinase n=1 Tax=Halioglobus japonicus TaxID=930805 RepID=A0AAP8SMZ8_9GAMM|nr:HAMP domain-containing sensor histidine kinase [Halioglobus japonicus]AQA18120.1 hypothetical protein BST95_07570 [Halioglobus japonicus]PLW86115.1 PAS domain S-box protein [Halioglobus japonicus]GHD14396.1 hypothetical protein GCM10007052_18080 [Halioglobus japonicus]